MYDDKDGNPIACTSCGNTDIRRAGMQGKSQRYQCKSCLKFFVPKNPDVERQKRKNHRLAMLLYMAGAKMSEMGEVLNKAHPTLKSWITPLSEIFVNDRALKQVRRKKNAEVIMAKSLSDMPDLNKKFWLLIEVEEDSFDGNSVIIYSKTSR